MSQLVNAKKRKIKDLKSFNENKDGKLIINNSSDDENEKKPEISEDYYKQSLHSEVAFTRTPDGRVKFVKKRKREEQEQDGEQHVGKRWNTKSKPKIEKEDVSRMLGSKYKAKKAGGDIKRSGMEDPYAYIPLKGTIVGNMYRY